MPLDLFNLSKSRQPAPTRITFSFDTFFLVSCLLPISYNR